MKLRTIGMAAVAALSLVAGRAEAQDAGWDTQYGILFTLPNPFGGGSGRDVINDYNGLVGFQYNLEPQTALRLSARLSRHGCGGTETDDGIGGTVTKDVCLDLAGAGLADANSTYGLGLQAEYLMRMTPAAVSPYFGAGAFVTFDRASLKGETESSVTPFTPYEYANKSNQIGLGVLGKAGLEWRINKVIALFAEYQATLELVSYTSTTMDEKSGATVYEDSKSTTLDFFNLDTGLANNGLIGVIAFF